MAKNMRDNLSFFQQKTDDVMLDADNKTKVITYNTNDQQRNLTAVKRKYDNRAVNLLLNSALVQEGVKKGDFFGYFGHWIREELGLNPREGGFIDGKIVIPDPALHICHLSCTPTGDVSFQVQFLDTPMGRMAKRVYSNKKGGFSIVWQFAKRNGDNTLYPYEFHGFDFVLQPNYSGNRGYAMDSLNARNNVLGELVAMDDITAQGAMQSIYLMNDYIADLQAANNALRGDIARQDAVIEDLTNIMARNGTNGVALDSIFANADKFIAPTITKGTNGLSDANSFMTAKLERYKKEDASQDAPRDVKGEAMVNSMLRT